MSLDPIRYDMTIQQGASFDDSITLQDADGVVMDLTGCTSAMQLRPSSGAPAVILEMSNTNGKLVLGGPLGTIRRALTDEQTATLPPGDYVYDLFITWPDGHADCLITGYATINARITEAA